MGYESHFMLDNPAVTSLLNQILDKPTQKMLTVRLRTVFSGKTTVFWIFLIIPFTI